MLNDNFTDIFGYGEDLEPSHLILRSIFVFVVGLVLFRVAGRRSFALGTAFDNVLMVMSGAILSRLVMGTVPMMDTLIAATTLAILYRLFGIIAYYSSKFGKIVKGDMRIIYENGQFNETNMKYCMITINDILQTLRSTIHDDSFEKIDSIVVERGGGISIVKKKEYC